jgi:hypothetical protein
MDFVAADDGAPKNKLSSINKQQQHFWRNHSTIFENTTNFLRPGLRRERIRSVVGVDD